MQLSTKDKRILACIQHKADGSVREIARLSGYREHAVRYCIAQLLERGIISRRAYINVYPLGYYKQALFFSVAGDSKRLRSQLIDFLISSPQVAYVAELGGAYEYKVDICGKALKDFIYFLDTLTRKFGNVLHSKAHASLVQLADFPLRVAGVRNDAFTMGVREQRVEIDPLDHRILCAMSAMDSKTYHEIARSLGIAISTLHYRLQQLHERGILVGLRYLVDASALGMQSFFHLVYTKGLSVQSRDQLYEYCRCHPHVDYFVQCIGSWDYEIGTSVESAQESLSMVQGLYEQFGKWVDEVSTLPLFRYHKVSNFPFLDEFGPIRGSESWSSPLKR